jgi:TonB family protein
MDDLRQVGDARVRAECPRLMGGGTSASGAANYTLTIDPSGTVLRARLDRSSGDRAFDDHFGRLAARLALPAPQAMTAPTMQAGVVIGYSCAPQNAFMTLEMREAPQLRPPQPPPLSSRRSGAEGDASVGIYSPGRRRQTGHVVPPSRSRHSRALRAPAG